MPKQGPMAQDREQSLPNTPSASDLNVAAVVHDMNQLFGVIMGRAGKMLAANPDSTASTDLEAIILAARDAASMAARLQGQTEAGAVAGGYVSLDRVIAQAILFSANDEDRSQWPVSVEVPDNLCSSVPAQVLREVLGNLLRNAQTAMSAGGAVSVEACLEDGRIRLLVQDQGPGLSATMASQIFEVGFTTSGEKNRGVGLPASRMLIQSHGGDLNFVPTSETGALFALTIPLGEVLPSEPEAETPRLDIKGSTSVLVVDDDQAMREMLFDVLGALGCQVVLARDATAALECMAGNKFQIALVDQNLPGMNGVDLAGKIRQMDPLLTLILITGWGNEDLDLNLAGTDLDLVARKPLEFGAIRDLIGQGLNIRDEKIK